MDYYYQVVDDDVPPSKRPRTLNEQTPTPMPIPTTTAPLFPPPTDPHSIGRNASAMFFKTRLCQRFSRGSCPYGDRCTFAHGLAELRPSLSNWQDMTAGIPQPPLPPPPNATATKICWTFQSRGACSYGEHCTFRHVADAGVAYDGLHHQRHGNGPHSGPPDGPAPLPRKPCFEWQSKGRCPYGDRCMFSHEAAVAAGIQKAGDHAELNSGSGGVAPWRPIREAADEPETEFEFEFEAEPEPEAAPVPPVRGRGFQKMLKKKKIAGIYGDSLDEE